MKMDDEKKLKTDMKTKNRILRHSRLNKSNKTHNSSVHKITETVQSLRQRSAVITYEMSDNVECSSNHSVLMNDDNHRRDLPKSITSAYVPKTESTFTDIYDEEAVINSIMGAVKSLCESESKPKHSHTAKKVQSRHELIEQSWKKKMLEINPSIADLPIFIEQEKLLPSNAFESSRLQREKASALRMKGRHGMKSGRILLK